MARVRIWLLPWPLALAWTMLRLLAWFTVAMFVAMAGLAWLVVLLFCAPFAGARRHWLQVGSETRDSLQQAQRRTMRYARRRPTPGITGSRPVGVNPPPGWYVDPAGAGARRWWNGVAWTEHVDAPHGPSF
jgi:hypothetical protein